jgi:FMN reductase
MVELENMNAKLGNLRVNKQVKDSFTLVTVNGSYRSSTKTGALIDMVIAEIMLHFRVELKKIEVHNLGDGFRNAFFRNEVSEDVNDSFRVVENADILVVGSPVYQASYSGLFKHFFDMVSPEALIHKPVILTAVGGSERHSLMIEYALRPLFSYFNTLIIPTYVYAKSDELANKNHDLCLRIKRTVSDLMVVLGVDSPRL